MYLLAIAALVAAFVALYPYLDGMGVCVSGGCPEASQTSHTATGGLATACLLVAAVLASTPAVSAFAAFGGRPAAASVRPAQHYLSPEPPPPKAS
jgi:amino acid transporter